MSDAIDEIRDLFSTMISRLSKEVSLHMVILFGSRARGDHTWQSDYDIVIVADFHGNFLSRAEWVAPFLPDVPVDMFCYTLAEFESLFADFNLTAIDAIGEGMVLHGDACFQAYKARHAGFLRKGMRKGSCALHLPRESSSVVN